ncbi:MAG: hypothetical protein HYX72_07405 [Acidobacteria bacterium]|nr:hypothetical protein [Acidobacteriota bacterium]
MHRRQLVILYLSLCIVAISLAWKLASDWRRAGLRYARVRASAAVPASAARPAPPVTPAAMTVAENEIIAKNLFSPDRTNQIEAQDDKLEAPPPAPIVYGTMNLGGNYEALMAEGGQAGRSAFRRVKNGEQLGRYTVVDIRDEKVVVEFRGQKTIIDVYESANSVPRETARTTVAATPVVEGAAAPQQAPAAPEPSAAPAPSAGAQQGTDSSTVEGNRRRVERQTPFGTQVWYEDIQK